VFILIEKYAFHRPVASVYLWVSAAVVLLIVYAHRGNIGRLRAGTEHRFGGRRQPADSQGAGRHV